MLCICKVPLGAYDRCLLHTELTSIKQHVTPGFSVAAQPDAFFVTRFAGHRGYLLLNLEDTVSFSNSIKRPVLELS